MIKNKKFKFIIYGNPIPLARVKHFYDKKRGFAWSYLPKRSKEYQEHVKHAFLTQKQKLKIDKPFKKPLYVHMIFYMRIPKYLPDVKDNTVHIKRPDISNLAKAIEDAGNKILWEDDNLICKEFIEKYYSNTPRVEVIVKLI